MTRILLSSLLACLTLAAATASGNASAAPASTQLVSGSAARGYLLDPKLTGADRTFVIRELAALPPVLRAALGRMDMQVTIAPTPGSSHYVSLSAFGPADYRFRLLVPKQRAVSMAAAQRWRFAWAVSSALLLRLDGQPLLNSLMRTPQWKSCFKVRSTADSTYGCISGADIVAEQVADWAYGGRPAGTGAGTPARMFSAAKVGGFVSKMALRKRLGG